MTSHDSGTAGDEARELASPPRAIIYDQAETGYRSVIDARERSGELANRDLMVRAHATLKARGTYDPQRHGDAEKYQPLTAEEHLEMLAAGEMLARYYRHPRAHTPGSHRRCVVAADRRGHRLRRGDGAAGLPGGGRQPAPPVHRLPGQIRHERHRARRRDQPRRRAASRGRLVMAAGDIVRVTANCGLDWTGPRHAWDVWFSDRHAHEHNEGRDGLPASCDGLTVTLAEPDPYAGEHDQDWAGPGFTRPGPERAIEHRSTGRQAEAEMGP